ncbi:hypothetical protein MTO96_004479 [Rhipicephalus appendiculatus]
MPDEQRLLWEPLAGRLVRDALASARKQLRAEAHLAARLVAAALSAAIGPPPAATASLSEQDAAKATAAETTTTSRRHQRTSAAPPWSLLPACCAVRPTPQSSQGQHPPPAPHFSRARTTEQTAAAGPMVHCAWKPKPDYVQANTMELW